MHYLHPGQIWSPCDTAETVARPPGERTSDILKLTCQSCIERLPEHLLALLTAVREEMQPLNERRAFIVGQMGIYFDPRNKREVENEPA